MTECETPLQGGIVVALDGTNLAESALDLAVEMARRFDVGLKLVTVLDKHVVEHFRSFCEGERVSLDEAAEAYQRRVARDLEEEGLTVERHVVGLRNWSAPETILDVADGLGASLVVIGSHGRSGVKRLVLGSVAEAVARHASIPVLIVRPLRARAHLAA